MFVPPRNSCDPGRSSYVTGRSINLPPAQRHRGASAGAARGVTVAFVWNSKDALHR